jgi:site-specific DNA-cytosine methylase
LVLSHAPALAGVARDVYLNNLLEESVGSSGQTFTDFIGAVAEHLPPWLGFENVPELVTAADGANIDFVINSLLSLGYVTAYRVFVSTDYLLVQKRRRVFGVAALISATGVEEQEAQILVETVMQKMEAFKFNTPVALDDLLLANNDPHVKKMGARAVEVRVAVCVPRVIWSSSS